MKEGKSLFLIIGAIVLVATLVIGFLNIKSWEGLILTSFIFVILAEIVFFGGFYLVKRTSDDAQKVFYYSGASSTIVMYSLATIVVSLIFMKFNDKSINLFMTIQIILLVLFLISFLVIGSLSKKVKSDDSEVLNSISKIESYIDRLNILKSNSSNKPYALTFKKLAEDLRFTDISTTVEADDKIVEILIELEKELEKSEEEISENEIENMSDKLKSLVKQRKIEVNATKRGGI